MPGIYGYVKNSADDPCQIKKMTDAMHLYDHFIQDDLFEDENMAASRVHLGQIGEKSSPFQKKGIMVWVEGEAYNHTELAASMGLETGCFSECLADAYCKGALDAFLNKLDGYFCAGIYDSLDKKLFLISDRYGMRFLYWYWHKDFFAFSSEVKGLLTLDGVDQTINPSSMECFMDLGYLLGENTWFEHIKLIRPATVISFNLKSKAFKEYHYWKWSEIKPSGLSFKDAVDALGYRFIQAVARRFNPDKKIGISLSGGLDSRAIFAAVHHLYPDYEGTAYTFGVPGCDDIKIASQVVALTDWRHRVFYFSDANWFLSRFEKIWNTDGMLDMMHMHGSEFLNKLKGDLQINLNGFLGDAVIGASYFKSENFKNYRTNTSISKIYYDKHSQRINPQDDFFEIDHIDPFLFMNRGRRFINMGSINSLVQIEQRKPFFDNGVMELLFSLPDEYRLNNRLYSSMLQKFFPDFFKTIPWQKTGKPAGIVLKDPIPKRAVNKLSRIIMRMKGKKTSKGYTDYPSWIRTPDVASKLEELLTREGSCYSQYTAVDFKKKYLVPHISSKIVNNSNEILRAATIEIYFQSYNTEQLKKV